MNFIPISINWPQYLQKGLPIPKLLQSQKISLSREFFPSKYLSYILQLVVDRKLKISTFQICLCLASEYKRNQSKFVQSTQLLLLVCIFIGSKLVEHDPLSIGELHHVSNHCYTNKDIYRMEGKILASVDFDIPKKILPSHQVKLIIKMIQKFADGYYKEIEEVTELIETIILYYIYTEKIKIQEKFQQLLPLAIVQIALMICSQCTGRFPPTVWAMKALKINEDDISNMVQDLMKLLLGCEKFSEISIL